MTPHRTIEWIKTQSPHLRTSTTLFSEDCAKKSSLDTGIIDSASWFVAMPVFCEESNLHWETTVSLLCLWTVSTRKRVLSEKILIQRVLPAWIVVVWCSRGPMGVQWVMYAIMHFLTYFDVVLHRNFALIEETCNILLICWAKVVPLYGGVASRAIHHCDARALINGRLLPLSGQF